MFKTMASSFRAPGKSPRRQMLSADDFRDRWARDEDLAIEAARVKAATAARIKADMIGRTFRMATKSGKAKIDAVNHGCNPPN